MTPFRIGDGAPVARKFGETLRVTAHGQDAPRSRARPGLAVAKPHVTAPLPTRLPARGRRLRARPVRRGRISQPLRQRSAPCQRAWHTLAPARRTFHRKVR